MTARKRVLTGVKPTGVPHIGNYLGAIEPALELARQHDSFLFIADLHALTIHPDPDELREQTYSVAATWIAFGLDPAVATFYRQSDVPEIPMLSWLLSCQLPLGMLNRAHSFKDVTTKGMPAEDVRHGLFSYPVLMAADILAFDADIVPVGKDQKQHLEIAQEAARKFNNLYGDGEEILRVPEARIDQAVMTVPGLDGEKMSKSRDNTIQVFEADKPLLKRVKAITTNSTEYGAPLAPDGDTLFALYSLLASPEKTAVLRRQYETGRKNPDLADDDEDPSGNYFGWGDAKKALHALLIERFSDARATYHRLMDDRAHLDALLAAGAERAREAAQPVLDRALKASGIR